MVKAGTRHHAQILMRLWSAFILLLVFFMSAKALQAAVMPSYQTLPPILANLNAPNGVAIGPGEAIYVAESSKNRVQIYSAGGQYLSTLSGLSTPTSIAVGGDGKIYVGNTGRGNVEVYSSSLALLGTLGSGDGEFVKPSGIAVDLAGKVYVVDSGANIGKVFNSDFSFDFSFGNPGPDPGSLYESGELYKPSSIAVNESTGELVVTDLREHSIYRSATWYAPQGWKDVARVQIFNRVDGSFDRVFSTFGPGTAFVRPLGVSLDGGSDYRIYVTDSYQNMVLVYNNTGTYLGNIYDAGRPLRNPVGVAFAPGTSRLFVASLRSPSVETYGIDAQFPITGLTPSSHDFGEVLVGESSASRTFTVSNTGAATLSVGAISISGDNAADFTIQSDNCSGQNVAPASSCTLGVRFVPLAGHAKNASLDVPTNDIYALTISSALGGMGLQEEFLLTVAKVGSAGGTIQGAGIDCGSGCNEYYPTGTVVNLTATPNANGVFAGWSGGGCSGTSGCAVTVNSDVTVMALFDSDGSGYTPDPNSGPGPGPSPDPNPSPNPDPEPEPDPESTTLTSILEVGEVSVDNNWRRVVFGRRFDDPIVVAKSASLNDSEPGAIRIRNVSNNGFDIRFQEWDYLDKAHAVEYVGYLVMERGSHTLADGTLIEAGRFDSARTSSFGNVAFSQSFNTKPVMMASVMTANESDAVTSRLSNIDTNGFAFRMQEQQANEQSHATEAIGYIAWEPSTGVLGNGLAFEVANAVSGIDHQFARIDFGVSHQSLPTWIADMQSTTSSDVATLRWRNKDLLGVEVRVDEEQSKDQETDHAVESIGYMAFSTIGSDSLLDTDGDGLMDGNEISIYDTNPLVADSDGDGKNDGDEVSAWGQYWSDDADQDGVINLMDADADNDSYLDGLEWMKGSDPADPSSIPSLGTMLEVGEVRVSGDWKRVNLRQGFIKPIVVAKPASYNGAEPAVVRVRNVDATGFDLRIQEWGRRPEVHTYESVSYFVMEQGSHRLPDGTQLEAGQFSTNKTTAFEQVGFNRPFGSTPVVIASVTSYNDMAAVIGRIRSVDADGFEYRLQEKEYNLQLHGEETISYIAAELISGVGLPFEIGRTGNNIDHYFRPIAFNGTYSGPPAFMADIQTGSSLDTANLRWRNRSAFGIEVRVHEEQSRDTEMLSTAESVGYIVIDLGASR